MANHFEQYDESPSAKPSPKTQSNHFAQYDAPSTTAVAVEQHYGVTDLPHAWRTHGVESAGKFGEGMLNIVRHPIDTLESLATLTGGVGAIAGSKLAGGQNTPEARASMLLDHPKIQHMIDAANAVGGMYKQRYGSPQAVMDTLATDPVGFAADLSTLATGGAGAMRTVGLKGAAKALTNTATVTNPMLPSGLVSYPSRAIAGVGKALAVARQPNAAKVVNTVAHYTDPRTPLNAMGRFVERKAMGAKNTLVNDAAEGHEAALRAALATSMAPPRPAPGVQHFAGATRGEIVPGSPPNPAEAVANLKTSNSFAALVKAAAKRSPFSTEADRLRAVQNAANIKQVDQVGRTPAILDKHLQDTATRSDNNYNISNAVHFKMPNDMKDLLDLPYNNELISEAMDLAKQQGRVFANGTKNVPAHQIPDPYGQNLPPINVPAKQMVLSGEDVHILKRAFDSLAFKKKNAEGWDKDKLDALKGTRDEFLEMVARPENNPAYNIGRAQHKADMRIANQMEFGQYIGDILKKPLQGDETPELRGDMVAAALGSEFNSMRGRTSVKNATGTNIGGRYPKDLLEPEQMAKLQSVVKNLARTKLANEQAKSGGDFAPRLGTAATDHKLPITLRHGDNLVVTLAHLLTNSEGADKLIGDSVAKSLQTVPGAEKLLADLIERKGAINNAKTRLKRIGAAVTKYPAAGNALQSVRDDKEQRSK